MRVATKQLHSEFMQTYYSICLVTAHTFPRVLWWKLFCTCNRHPRYFTR